MSAEARHHVLDMGPAHPATRGALKLRLELHGEQVVNADVQVGYAHRGFEKECESRPWSQGALYAERLNYHSAAVSATAYCLAVESLAGLEPPARAGWLRVLVGELARLTDHLTRLGVTCHQLGALTAFMYAVQARERVTDLIEAVCGARVTPAWLRIGGVARDVPPDFAAQLERALSDVERGLDAFDQILIGNRVFIDRLRNTGALPRERLIEYGVTGPLLRAAGVPYDLRTADPYLTYAELDFDVPVGLVGDNYDRFLVVREEIAQSAGLARQCLVPLAETAGAPIRVDDPAWGGATDDPAQLRDGPPVPAGEVYRAVESPNGELGFFVISDGGPRPWKVRCRPPSFAHAAALGEMVRGGMLADVVPTLDLINAVGGECDR